MIGGQINARKTGCSVFAPLICVRDFRFVRARTVSNRRNKATTLLKFDSPKVYKIVAPIRRNLLRMDDQVTRSIVARQSTDNAFGGRCDTTTSLIKRRLATVVARISVSVVINDTRRRFGPAENFPSKTVLFFSLTLFFRDTASRNNGRL